MQQDYIAASHLTPNFFLDHCRRRSVPVMAGHVPHYGFESEFTRDSDRRWAPASKRRTEEIRMITDCVLQRGAAVHELRSRSRLRFEDEQGMREGVIADEVSGLRHGARDIGALLHILSNHEECRSHVVLRQHFEEI